MKTDHYLNLCLEQAEQSPLHYRHGCVVVKGGKVIGKGFNDYRPGYDGGALKTGQLPTKPTTLEKLGEDKPKKKNGFKPFENTVGLQAGGHRLANNCLTMHSEMMAINSALQSSNTSAATNLSYLKPSTALSYGSKRKRQFRWDILNAFVQSVCYETSRPHTQQGTAPIEIAGWRFESYTYTYDTTTSCLTRRSSSSPPSPLEGEPWERVQFGRAIEAASSAQIQHLSIEEEDEPSSCGDSSLKSKHRKDHNMFSGSRRFDHGDKLTLPNSDFRDAIPSSHDVKDRMKHPKLRGADVYVARLGSVSSSRGRGVGNTKKSEPDAEQDANSTDCRLSSAPTLVNEEFRTGSLYDELMCKELKTSLPARSEDAALKSTVDCGNALDSRPCYRCVLYMHSAGIRRVYWTNNQGQWENAKVRDLFDQVSGNNVYNGSDANSGGRGGVFVTKHEILMLRRLSDQKTNQIAAKK
ncbi:uncharacterized protein F4822DRAFT_427726 [Hypoxylon trugodes]|uniref:uncharacterized protein n=1 Tax=Hypoxylon trugodes TaxID=326681 RepID=UPI00218E6970|nr:uncharacterized protein F4822DRAFT_427726 [Hypoxylon trugodes]KAI1389372.1 hypothetical protein F4822DRAFT_427726 [Hypoxylon trugodes]